MCEVQTADYLSFSNIQGMEKVFPMKPQRRRKKKESTSGIRRQLPKDFICIAPDEARHVFDLMNGSAQEHEKEIARLHFHLCLHCQEAVAGLHLIVESLSNDAKVLLHSVANYSDSTVTAGSVTKPDSAHSEDRLIAGDTKTLCTRAAR